MPPKPSEGKSPTKDDGGLTLEDLQAQHDDLKEPVTDIKETPSLRTLVRR